ncbi:hypothetical protein KAJ83_18470 [Marivibrio halodurans]|uniref:Uncharacterized protein n=1 Tax=Marivibrio halodurans TaxID=2039722 RepID=A0A8J7SQD8_9PROT|nr:hypothetical protein [Marivibrio halodurans]MBP5859011.1 hypothetical protein [Marivibrio halodurans]
MRALLFIFCLGIGLCPGIGLPSGAAMAADTGAAVTPAPWTAQLAACCKTCRKGKACGDSCIRADYRCTKPPGCACDGVRPPVPADWGPAMRAIGDALE